MLNNKPQFRLDSIAEESLTSNQVPQIIVIKNYLSRRYNRIEERSHTNCDCDPICRCDKQCKHCYCVSDCKCECDSKIEKFSCRGDHDCDDHSCGGTTCYCLSFNEDL